MADFPVDQLDFMVRHTACLLASFRHWTGRELLDVHGSPEEVARAVFESPMIIISHGTERDPVLNYGNRAALALWEMDWNTLTRTPSRLTAEQEVHGERAALLRKVALKGYMAHYHGIRISRSGRRFRINDAMIWNLLDARGGCCGQAAAFERWCYIR
jgi:hypothetical protein